MKRVFLGPPSGGARRRFVVPVHHEGNETHDDVERQNRWSECTENDACHEQYDERRSHDRCAKHRTGIGHSFWSLADELHSCSPRAPLRVGRQFVRDEVVLGRTTRPIRERSDVNERLGAASRGCDESEAPIVPPVRDLTLAAHGAVSLAFSVPVIEIHRLATLEGKVLHLAIRTRWKSAYTPNLPLSGYSLISGECSVLTARNLSSSVPVFRIWCAASGPPGGHAMKSPLRIGKRLGADANLTAAVKHEEHLFVDSVRVKGIRGFSGRNRRDVVAKRAGTDAVRDSTDASLETVREVAFRKKIPRSRREADFIDVEDRLRHTFLLDQMTQDSQAASALPATSSSNLTAASYDGPPKRHKRVPT